MDEQLINLGIVSLYLVLAIGALVLFIVLFRRSKPPKKDFNSEIKGFERLYQEGKINKQEYNQIRMTLMQKYGGNLPPEVLRAGLMNLPNHMFSGPNTESDKNDSDSESKDSK